MKVLLTGAFGNVGASTINSLLDQGHDVRCFDVMTPANKKIASRYGNKIEVIWGDIRDVDDVNKAVSGQNTVIHLCFIIASTMSHTGKSSEEDPKWSEAINIGGTENLINAMKAEPKPPYLVFASSVSVYGITQDREPPCKADDPVVVTDNYSKHKIECEKMVKASGLDWTILRFGAVVSFDVGANPDMFMMSLDNRIEFVDTRDVGVACANAASCEEAKGKILLIGGGEKCQLLYRELVIKMLNGLGIGMLPEEAFTKELFYIDWLDTREAEELLKFQKHTFDDYINEMKKVLGFKRHLARIFRPIAKRYLLSKSPYYKQT